MRSRPIRISRCIVRYYDLPLREEMEQDSFYFEVTGIFLSFSRESGRVRIRIAVVVGVWLGYLAEY